MPPKRDRRETDLETNAPPDLAGDNLRRRDQRATPPDSLPPRDDARRGEEPVGGGFTPRADGGNPQHPSHDDDPSADAGPGDYERELDRMDAAGRGER
ncbi:MAG: hypothetical protein ACK4UO_10870 [Pseudolabrys sp.]